MNIQVPKHTSILLSRTDSIGDVVLTIPLAAALKKYFPDNKIIFLADTYTKPVLQYILDIDEILVYNEIKKLSRAEQQEILHPYNISTAVMVFPTYEIAKFLYRMKIPYKIATSHRWYNWLFCNQRISFSRKKSDLHEAQLNFKLLQPLGIKDIPTLDQLKTFYHLKPISPLPDHIYHLIDKDKYKIILHPKSKGSAREWGIQNYIRLIKKLDKSKFQIIITGTKSEENALQEIFSECPETLNMVGKTNLTELISLINNADALIAASTGTLHIAAMLDKHTIGLFPSIRPMHPGRWAPIGKNTHILYVDKYCTDCKKDTLSCSCIQSISHQNIIQIIEKIFTNTNNYA